MTDTATPADAAQRPIVTDEMVAVAIDSIHREIGMMGTLAELTPDQIRAVLSDVLDETITTYLRGLNEAHTVYTDKLDKMRSEIHETPPVEVPYTESPPSNGIFGGDYEQLGEYIAKLKSMMGLRDWTIHIQHDRPDNPNFAADVYVYPGRRSANIRFDDDWGNADPEDFRETCVHELLHCHINPIRTPIDNLDSTIGKMVYVPLYAEVTDRIELAIDAIAAALAPHLPLPGEEWSE